MVNLTRRLFRSVALVIGQVAGVTALAGAIAIISITQVVEAQKEVEHTYNVITLLEDLLGNLRDAETGSRGFVITKDKAYLEPYNNAIQEIDQQLEKLGELTSDNQNQIERVRSLNSLTRKRLEASKRIVTLTQQADLTSNFEVPLIEGKRLMDEIRSVVASMQQEEYLLLRTRQEKLLSFIVTTYLAIIIIIFVGFLTITLSYNFITDEMEKRKELEERLKELNQNLFPQS